MPSFSTFKTIDQKCSTCQFYQGARRFGMQANKPYYVYADAGQTPCLTNPKRQTFANNRCPMWQKWNQIP